MRGGYPACNWSSLTLTVMTRCKGSYELLFCKGRCALTCIMSVMLSVVRLSVFICHNTRLFAARARSGKPSITKCANCWQQPRNNSVQWNPAVRLQRAVHGLHRNFHHVESGPLTVCRGSSFPVSVATQLLFNGIVAVWKSCLQSGR